MKKIKIILLLALSFTAYQVAEAVINNFQVSYDALLKPSNELLVELAPLDLKLELETTTLELKQVDLNLATSSDRQIYSVLSDRKVLLENTYRPIINETQINTTLNNYRTYRENQIRNEIQNVALQNDEIGVLDEEVEEYANTLRLELANYAELKQITWEREYRNLQADLSDFSIYVDNTISLRSATMVEEPKITETKAVEIITANKEEYSDKVDDVKSTQTTIVSRLSDNISEEDNSLLADKNQQLLTSISNDQIVLNSKLEDLAETKETVAALDAEIKLMEEALSTESDAIKDTNPYATMPSSDLVILRETSVAELEKTVDVYEQQQDDVQLTLTSSITNLTNLNLRK